MKKLKSLSYQLQGCLLTFSEVRRHAPDGLSDEELMCSVQEEAKLLMGVLKTDNEFQCLRCGNKEDFYNYEPGEITYCLSCLNLGRISTKTPLYYFPVKQVIYDTGTSELSWEGTLSPYQANIAEGLVQRLSLPSIDLLHAVTGSGKTEMIFPLISKVLSESGRVCIATPRIDVCLELYPRLQSAFSNSDVQLLYGDNPDKLRYTPITIATTHQLLRFKEAFDLLIIDEVDSFPYVDDPSLHYGVETAVKSQGKRVYLTATPDHRLEEDIKQGVVYPLILPGRYHGYPLPIPAFQWIGDWRQSITKRKKFSSLWFKLQEFIRLSGAKLIFMPNIELAESLHNWLREAIPDFSHQCVHAQDPYRKEKVQALRDGEVEGLITTTILERGVTFTNCQVFVIGAEHRQFNKSSLVQISGRVGRRPDHPKGTLIYGHYGRSHSMIRARQEIEAMNREARFQGMIRYEG